MCIQTKKLIKMSIKFNHKKINLINQNAYSRFFELILIEIGTKMKYLIDIY